MHSCFLTYKWNSPYQQNELSLKNKSYSLFNINEVGDYETVTF